MVPNVSIWIYISILKSRKARHRKILVWKTRYIYTGLLSHRVWSRGKTKEKKNSCEFAIYFFWIYIFYHPTPLYYAFKLSHIQLFVTPWTVACQNPLSTGFSRQEYWRRLPFPSTGHLPNPGIEPTSLASSALAAGLFNTEPPGKSILCN